ncbi:MAG: hypothetical protein ACRDHP_04655, partial [Ktedonobacterales bacterium]
SVSDVRAAGGATVTSHIELPAGAIVEDEAISRALEMAETAMLGLRLGEGVDLAEFTQRYGEDFHTVFGSRLAVVQGYDLLEERDGFLRLTPRGRLLGNEVFERLLPDEGRIAVGV